MAGTPTRVDPLRRRSQGDVVINTASIERLNATFGARLATLTRRGLALASRPVTLPHGMYLIGTVDNFCTPQASLHDAGRATTPARAAGITDHGWTVRELLSFQWATTAAVDTTQEVRASRTGTGTPG